MSKERTPKPGTMPLEQSQLEALAVEVSKRRLINISHVRREILERAGHLLGESMITEPALKELDRDLQTWKPAPRR